MQRRSIELWAISVIFSINCVERREQNEINSVFLLMAPINNNNIIESVFCADSISRLGVRYDPQIWLDWGYKESEAGLRKNTAHSVVS